jgi:hypothetical protein
MAGQQILITVETERGRSPYNQISLKLFSRTEGDLSPTVFRERGDVIAKDQLDAPRFELLVDEFPELIRELVVK